jgi:hypothetical protein
VGWNDGWIFTSVSYGYMNVMEDLFPDLGECACTLSGTLVLRVGLGDNARVLKNAIGRRRASQLKSWVK